MKHLPYAGTDGLYDGYDFDVTVVEDEYWDEAETANLTPVRKRVTTSVQSPIELSVLLEICKAEK